MTSFPLRYLISAAALLLPLAAHATPDDRLGHLVVPVSESIRLDLDATRPTYAGRVEIDLRITAAVDTFALNALDLDLKHVELHDDAGPVDIVCTPDGRGRLQVRAGRRLVPGRGRLGIEFANDFDTSGNALYRYEEAGRSYISSQFQAVAAREAFPCWDEPEFKIPWTIIVEAPKSDLVVSNSAVDREVRNGSRKTVFFRATPPLPAYLVALVAGPYVSTSIEGLPVPGRIISVADRDGLAREAARITPRILLALEDYFGRPFPFEKLDLIALPEYQGGAMENAAAITFSEELLLVDPANTTPGDRRFMVTTLVHEIAHMWFGDLVTMEWWNDLWLSESFATWMENRVTNELFPEFNLDVVTRQFAESAMNSDARPSARAVRSRVNAFDNMDLLFDSFSYEKGGAVLSMLEDWIGAAAFRAGVRLYMNEYAWRNATAEDLWHCMSRAAGRSVGDVARSFIDQPGVPFITASIGPDGKPALSQRRFTPAGTDPGSSVWSIPLELRISGRLESHRVLLSSPDTVLSITGSQAAVLTPEVGGEPIVATGGSSAWIHPNGGERGYCRWSVSGEILDRMAALPDTVLSPRERLGFVYNLMALLEAGAMDGGRYLDLLSAFGDDPESEVILAVVEGLEAIRSTFSGSYPRAAFQDFVKRTLGPALERIGFDPRPGEPIPVTLLRPRLILALGDLGDDADVRDRLRPGTVAWLKGNAGLHPSLIDAGLSLLASRGDAVALETIRDRFETVGDPTDHRRLLNALGGFRSPDRVTELLDYSLNEDMRSGDMLHLARRLSRQPEDRGLVFRWLTEHYDAFAGRLPAYRVAELPELARSCDGSRMTAVRVFFQDPGHQVEGTLTSLSEVLSRIEESAALREREKGAVAKRLGAD